MQEKKKNGRPTLYNEKLAKKMCEKIASDSRSVGRLCREVDFFPHEDTFYNWLKLHQKFAELYVQAKRQQVNILIEEIVEISDDTKHDTITKTNKNGDEYEVCNNEWVNRSRLRVDTRKWIATKLVPRLYGDKTQVEQMPLDPNNLTQEQLQKIVDNLPDKIKLEIAKQVAEKLKKLSGNK